MNSFFIYLTPYNFTPNHRTFTVSAISEDLFTFQSHLAFVSFQLSIPHVFSTSNFGCLYDLL
ncbi:hypothetical protein YC2023_103177 [Brassica napus]